MFFKNLKSALKAFFIVLFFCGVLCGRLFTAPQSPVKLFLHSPYQDDRFGSENLQTQLATDADKIVNLFVQLNLSVLGEATPSSISVGGMERFGHSPGGDLRGYSESMISQNGRQQYTRNYRYEITPNNFGTFTIGPATVVMSDGKSYRTNTVELKVEKSAAQPDIIVRATLQNVKGLDQAKPKVFVGQKFGVKLEVMFRSDVHFNQRIALDQTAIAACLDLSIKPVEQDFQVGQDFIGGHRYQKFTRNFDCTSLAPGLQQIPTFRIDYASQVASGARRPDPFSIMFGMGQEKHGSVFSNDGLPIIVDVAAIEEDVWAVGRDFSSSLFIEPQKFKAGQAVTLHLVIRGQDVNFDETVHPELDLDPSVWRVYNSGSEFLDKRADAKQKIKDFRYVVQTSQTGEVEIPAQTLACFDLGREEKVFVSTKPLKVFVGPAGLEASKPTMAQSSQASNSSQVQAKEVDDQEIIDGIDFRKKKDEQSTSKIWLILILLLFLGVSLFATHFMFGEKIKNWLRYRLAYRRATRALKSLQASSNAVGVYRVFVQYFVDRGQMEYQTPLLEAVTPIAKYFSPSDAQEFIEFIEMAADLVFGKGVLNLDLVQASLFLKDSLKWMQRLEQVNKKIGIKKA